eukprot:jgi/Ulvmu1/1199/UM108_0027.1
MEMYTDSVCLHPICEPLQCHGDGRSTMTGAGTARRDHHQSPLERTGDRRRTTKTLEERQERARERNRSAQARYRQKQKDNCDLVEQRIRTVQARRADAEGHRQQLRDIKRRLWARIRAEPPDLDQCPIVDSARIHALCSMVPCHPVIAKAVPITPQAVIGAPVDTIQTTPQPAQHDSITRCRLTSADLYAAPDLLPPPISSFRCCAGIGYQNLLEASASASGIIDFAVTGFLDVLQAAQTAAAQRLTCGQSHICWFMQSHYEVAPGVPLSFSSTLSSPECVASIVLHCMLGQVEVSILGLQDNPRLALRSGMRSAFPQHSAAQHSTAEHVPCFAEAAAKRARYIAQPKADNVYAQRSMHGDHACGDRPGGGTGALHDEGIETGEQKGGEPGQACRGGESADRGDSDCAGDGYRGDVGGDAAVRARSHTMAAFTAEPVLLRCGVNGTVAAAEGVRSVVQQAVQSAHACSGADTERAWEIVCACGDRAVELLEQFQASGGTGGKQPERREQPGPPKDPGVQFDGRERHHGDQGECTAGHDAQRGSGEHAPTNQLQHGKSLPGRAAAEAPSGGGPPAGECSMHACRSSSSEAQGHSEGREGAASESADAACCGGCQSGQQSGQQRGRAVGALGAEVGEGGAGATGEERLAVYHEATTRTLLAVLRAVA